MQYLKKKIQIFNYLFGKHFLIGFDEIIVLYVVRRKVQ